MLLAYGVLGDQTTAEDDPAETHRIIDVNFTSAAVWLQVAATALADNRPRTIIVIGSAAGDRGKRSNYVYGSAKAGLAAFAEGVGPPPARNKPARIAGETWLRRHAHDR